ncbi:hypothetical protein HY251_20920, partial [bacterium]|nr:hypothetical protein [bacterium]
MGGESGGKVGTGKGGDTKTAHHGGQLTDLAWQVPDANASAEIVLEPGKAIELKAKVSGFAEPPEVTFKVFKADGRKPSGKPIETLTGEVDEDAASATWTPPKDDPPTLPLRVVFTATAGKGTAKNGPTIEVDLGTITAVSWVSTKKTKSAHAAPGQDHFQRGDEVLLKAETTGFGKGATVKFQIYEHHKYHADKPVATLEATTEKDGTATSKKWKIPDNIEHDPPPPAAAPAPSTTDPDADPHTPPADWEKKVEPANHDDKIEKASEDEPRGAPPLPHYIFVASTAGHHVTSDVLSLEPDCLENFPDPPDWLDTKPARDLRLTDARTIVVNLIKWGVFTLGYKGRPLFKHTKDDPPVCEVTYPKPADHLNFKSDDIDGCTWYYIATGHKPPTDWRNSTDTKWKAGPNLDNIDMRNAVVIYRLTHFLRTVWGAFHLYDMGIGHGDEKHHAGDCHNTGRAIDFSGARGVIPEDFPIEKLRGHDYDLLVERDWGFQPIPEAWQKKSKPEHADWKDHESKGDPVRDYSWPDNYKGSNFDQTTYRLEANKDSDDLDKLAAYWFFHDVFTFATKQCSDASGD